jgi:hypothetical protein
MKDLLYKPREIVNDLIGKVAYKFAIVYINLVWFGLFVHPFSHTCNIRHVDYRLQFICCNTTYNIWTSTQYNIINNNTKYKYQLEVESVPTSRNMCIYTNIPKS